MEDAQPLSFTLYGAMQTCARLVYHLVIGHRGGWTTTADSDTKLTHAIKAVGTHRDLLLGTLLHRAAERCLTSEILPSQETLIAEACAAVRFLWRRSHEVHEMGDTWLGDANAARPFLTEIVSGRGIRRVELDVMRHRLDRGVELLLKSSALGDLRALPRYERLFVGDRPRLMQLPGGASGWLVPDAAYVVSDAASLPACDTDGVALTLAPGAAAVVVDWKCGSLKGERAREDVERQIRWYAALLVHGVLIGRKPLALPQISWADLRFVGRAVSLRDGGEHWFALSRDEVQAAATEFGEAFEALRAMTRDPATSRPRGRAELPVLPAQRRSACGRCLYELVCRTELAETSTQNRIVLVPQTQYREPLPSSDRAVGTTSG
jgi:hypothetical protein